MSWRWPSISSHAVLSRFADPAASARRRSPLILPIGLRAVQGRRRFLDLGSLKEANLVAVAAASALGLVIPVGDPTPRLLEALHDRQILLVLDSCEHVIEAVVASGRENLPACPRRLAAGDEPRIPRCGGRVRVRTGFTRDPAGEFGSEAELGRYSSTRLFMECAVAAGYASTVTDADAEVVARICRKLDGMPLAIELVASRLSAHGLVEIDELIEGRLRLAWRGRRTAPLRHQSLSAALDWSYELIAPEERTLLEYLSIFPGAFTLQGARALWLATLTTPTLSLFASSNWSPNHWSQVVPEVRRLRFVSWRQPAPTRRRNSPLQAHRTRRPCGTQAMCWRH